MSKKLDDVLDAKNGAIKDLQYELARVTKARSLLPHFRTPHFLTHAVTYSLPLTACLLLAYLLTYAPSLLAHPQAHNDVIRVYESKLTEFGIPVEELGFRPLLTNTGTGPAGLVVA